MYKDLKTKLFMYRNSKNTGSGLEQPTQYSGTSQLFQGDVASDEEGSYFKIEKEFPLTYLHGGYQIGKAREMNFSTLRMICNELRDWMTINDFLFLDTETTGLSGGAGTVAFLIGTGYFEKDRFVLRQFFMRDYDEEPAMLKGFNKLISEFKGIITFNGKAFDWNLLLSRFTFNRFRPALKQPVNFDLLFPSRKIWKLKLESCRLASLEGNILGEERVNDIPGFMIPSVYFRYLDNGNTKELEQVFKHNESDILSMVALLVKISTMLEDPIKESDGGLELLSLAGIFEGNNEEHSSVLECYEACMISDDYFVRESASKRLVNVYKRKRDYKAAASHCEKQLGNPGGNEIFLLVELAKYYEHRERNPVKALEAAEKAFQASLRVGYGNNIFYEELKKRLTRLRIKISKGHGLGYGC